MVWDLSDRTVNFSRYKNDIFSAWRDDARQTVALQMRRDVARPAVTRRCDSNLKPLGGETGPGGETGVHTYFDFYFTRKAGSALKLQMFLEALIAE